MKKMVESLLDNKRKMQKIFKAMSNTEDEIMGKELKYQGNYASVMYVDGNTQNARLYVESDDGANWEVDLSLQELLKLVE